MESDQLRADEDRVLIRPVPPANGSGLRILAQDE